jgi:hypothetical protein
MTTMITEIYDAFRDAGISEEKARRAAEAVASYENRFASIESTLRLHTWMLSVNTAGILALIGLVLHHNS